MESRDRVGKVLLITLVIILGFVAYKRTYSTENPSALTTVDKKSETSSVVMKEDLDQIMKDYIIAHPEVIIESIERMQKNKITERSAQAQEIIKNKKSVIYEDKVSPVIGSGNTSIVMLYDASCGYCKKANVVLNQLMDSDKDIRIIYKPLPIMSESSEYSAKIELSIYKLFPEKFKAVHDDIMAQKISTREDMLSILSKHSIPVEKVEGEFDNPEFKDSLKRTGELAAELQIQGVPDFIIGETLYQGILELDHMKAIINEVRAKTSTTTEKK
ncbi:MAG: hypothetical protein RLZZ59_601 [Pseudomonadota bacterium]|jgi:protein-disulfide isomerase